MIKYLKERQSWIAFIIFIHGLILFISYIDASIPTGSMLYIVFLSFVIFLIFLLIRYNKESKFYSHLENWENESTLTALSPYEKMVEKRLTIQTEQMQHELSQNRMALEQEKEELLTWIHEIKTPLTAMHLMIDRLDNNALKSQLTYEWLRVHLLLDQQLHQKRIPFIENDLYIEDVDLQAVIYKEIKNLQSWCIQKRIGFDLQLHITSVLSDNKWVAFILRQILTNAVKYSEKAEIILSTYEQDEHTFLSIQDFGIGISQKDLPRIFDKAFTATSHQNHAATGMGLYLANKVAQSLQIEINVQSELNKGTTFTLTFPKRNEFVHLTSM